jgi:hypothetical protein
MHGHQNIKFSKNNFDTPLPPQDPTNKFQKTLRITMNKCRSIILQNQKWKYINLNPSGSGGLVVSMLASGTQDRGFEPGRSRWILQVKNPSEGK